MMDEKFLRSMSAFTNMSEIAIKQDKMLGYAAGISQAYEKSASIMGDFDRASLNAKGIMPMLDATAWLTNEKNFAYSKFSSASMAFSAIADIPTLPSIPKWILDLSNPPASSFISAQMNWDLLMPSIPANSAVKSAMDILSGFKSIDTISKRTSDITKIPESILRFDASINNLYRFINEVDEDDEDFHLDIDGQLTTALSYDIENATTEESKIAIAYIFQNMLEALSNISVDFTLGNEQRLFINKLKSLIVEWQSSGKIFNTAVVLFYIFHPVISKYHENFLGLNDEKQSITVINNKTIVENNYIEESSFEASTVALKSLKDKPDNRYKTKFSIPIGTNLTILQNKGKWLEVKFICGGKFYSGWTLNCNLK